MTLFSHPDPSVPLRAIRGQKEYRPSLLRSPAPSTPPLNMTPRFITLAKTTALASLLVFTASAVAQDGTVYPLEAPAEPGAIVLGTGGVADQPATESWFRQWGEPMVRNVTTATLTPYLPDPAKANGTAVIVAPGGGFRWLSINNEGWKIAKALNERGIAAFVLKYRLQPTPPTLEGLKQSMNRTF